MNNQIKELAAQAGAKFVTHIFTYDGIGPGVLLDDFDLEKFAELLVRKCIKSTLSLHDTAIKSQWDTEETFHIIVDTIVEDLDMQHIFRSYENKPSKGEINGSTTSK